MDAQALISILAGLLVLTALVALRDCPCDDAACLLSHKQHTERTQAAQLRAIHDDYHSLPQPGCDYCNARDR